jgi:death on curing protein
MTEIIWIDVPEVLAIHAHQIDEHGGASGLRDRALLESALARPRQLLAYGSPDLFDLAAAYAASIIANHPFVDGNKRTGFVVGVLFMELNGPSLTVSEADATAAVLDLAAGAINETEFASWLRDNSK